MDEYLKNLECDVEIQDNEECPYYTQHCSKSCIFAKSKEAGVIKDAEDKEKE